MKELEKIDVLRKRLNVTYGEAKEALEQCGGDLVEALVYLERRGYTQAEGQEDYFGEDEKEGKWDKGKAESFVRGIIEQAKSLVQEGNVTKVRLVSGDKVLINIPATIGVVGLGVILFSPLLVAVTAVGAAAAVAKEMVFEVEKSDGTIERRNLKFPAFGSKKDEAGFDGDEESESGNAGIWDDKDE
ncbi:MAG: DUF4342 domain-containing protein [Clostridiales bacterium]|nr:DUF4342 domain-containing protein [Clostridiales bacterium]